MRYRNNTRLSSYHCSCQGVCNKHMHLWRAQQAYASMPSGDYSEVKAVILCRYDFTEETYRQRMMAATRKEGENYRESATRLMDLANNGQENVKLCWSSGRWW